MSQRKRKYTFYASDAARKLARQESARDICSKRIYIGQNKDEWDIVKAETNLSLDRDVAKMLLKCYAATRGGIFVCKGCGLLQKIHSPQNQQDNESDYNSSTTLSIHEDDNLHHNLLEPNESMMMPLSQSSADYMYSGICMKSKVEYCSDQDTEQPCEPIVKNVLMPKRCINKPRFVYTWLNDERESDGPNSTAHQSTAVYSTYVKESNVIEDMMPLKIKEEWDTDIDKFDMMEECIDNNDDSDDRSMSQSDESVVDDLAQLAGIMENCGDSEDCDIPQQSATGRPMRKSALASIKKGKRFSTWLDNSNKEQEKVKKRVKKDDSDFEPYLSDDSDGIQPSNLKGDASDVKGDASNLKSYASDLEGDISDYKGDVSDTTCSDEDGECCSLKSDHDDQGEKGGDEGDQQECELCNFVCHGEKKFQIHRFTAHKIPSPNLHGCNICFKIFRNIMVLSRHKKAEHICIVQKKLFVCPTCGIIIKNKSSFEGHCIKHEDPDYHVVCTVEGCGKKLAHSTSMLKHVNQCHGGIKKYACSHPGCDKKFYTGFNLSVHTRQHTGDEPFTCRYCSYTAKQNICLKLHMKSKHNGLPLMP